MPNGKYNVEIASLDYWRKQIKCQWGCPVKTDARGYINAIEAGEYLQAYKLARGPNPFASICGRVCGAPCEAACRRGSIDEPLTIRALKRFINERHGVEAGDLAATLAFSTARRDKSNPKAGTRIAVIGAGVGGMTAAHDLALLGYRVTVFESFSAPGGMLMTGVPLYRLPRELVQMEMNAILQLGIELRCHTEIGRDITVNQLRQQGYAAVLIAAGLQASRRLNIEGSDLDGVLHGIEFLKQVNTGREVKIGERVVVIGGGNVAFDVARSAVRSPSKADAEDFYEAADAARMALRGGAREVHLVCLESLQEMPADEVEITEGVEEGMQLHTLRGPDKIIGHNGRVTGLATKKVIRVFDENGRFNPSFAAEPGETINADTIIMAIGQSADFGFLNDAPPLAMTRNGLIAVDPQTKATSVPGIYACGDVADGAKLFIDAVRSGQVAAASIDAYVRGSARQDTEQGSMHVPGPHLMSERYLRLQRIHPPVVAADIRSHSSEPVEINYAEPAAREQAERCLKCHINTIFNGEKCIMCNGCVDVCPTHCLKLVSLSSLAMDETLEALVENRYDVSLKGMSDEERSGFLGTLGSAIIKDEEHCIRCGFCAKRCPTGAVTMEWFSYQNRSAADCG
jgi:NADPH-dependent glutamate synthase beta subunit-like oxidoreductase